MHDPLHTPSSLRPILLTAVLSLVLAATTTRAQQAQARDDKRADLKEDMRKLWVDHVTYTRLYIVSAAADLPEKDATAERLMKNQQEIGDAIKPYYGEQAGEQLSALLTDHIEIATEIIDAAKAGDDPTQRAAAERWNANADSVAMMLSKANPSNWRRADLQRMMRSHLDLTTQEVSAHLKKDWEASIAAYDKVYEQAIEIADALSDGIAKQFPRKVSQ